MSEFQAPQPTDQISLNGVSFTHDNILKVVDDFYTRIQNDEQLKVPFSSVHDWPEHIERLTHFWWTRFGGEPYLDASYAPPAKHYYAGFNEELLKRWLGLFHATLETHLNENQISIWKLVSEQMGKGLNAKNEYLIKTYGPPPKTT